MILTPEQASQIIGVPAVQLRRWAYAEWDKVEWKPFGKIGPINVGTVHKPMFDEEELIRWRERFRVGEPSRASTR